MIQGRLGAPADKEGGGDVGFGPVHNFHKLIPVVYHFKLHLLHRSAGDDQSVEPAFYHLAEGFIKFVNMALGCVFGFVGADR